MEIKYTFNPDYTPVKLNPQQTQLFKALKDLGTVGKEEILKGLEGNLTTKQDPWLIFKYYQPGFIKEGFVSLDKTMKPKTEKKSKGTVEIVVVKELAGDPMFSSESDEEAETVEKLSKQGW